MYAYNCILNLLKVVLLNKIDLAVADNEEQVMFSLALLVYKLFVYIVLYMFPLFVLFYFFSLLHYIVMLPISLFWLRPLSA